MNKALSFSLLLLTLLLLQSCVTDENSLYPEYRTQNGAAIYSFTNRDVISPIIKMLDIAVKYDEYAKAESEKEKTLLKDLYFPTTKIKFLGTADNPTIKLTSLFSSYLIHTGGKALDEDGAEWNISEKGYSLKIEKSDLKRGYKLVVKNSLVHSFHYSVLTNAELHSSVTKSEIQERNPFTYSISGSGNSLETVIFLSQKIETQISFIIQDATKAKRFDYYDFSFNRFCFYGGKSVLTATGAHLGSDSGEPIRIVENRNIELSDIIKVQFHGITETVDLRRLR